MDALNVNNAGNTTSPISGRNEFVLTEATSTVSGSGTFTTIPGVDGNPITVDNGSAAKFAASDLAAGYYAYVYLAATGTPTYIYTAVNTTTEAPDGWSTAGLWYKDSNGTTAISDGETTTPWAAGVYYKKYQNLNKVYGVKVIKVQ